MKVATRIDGTPDGELLVVSRDLARAVSAASVVASLREALERWDAVQPRLQELATRLDAGQAAKAFAFDPWAAAAPLPRAPQFLDGSTFLSHGQRMVRAFNLSTASLEIDFPLMYQGASDGFLGAGAAMPLPAGDLGIDMEAELAVITGPVPMGVSATAANRCVRLITIFDDVSLRRLLFNEIKLGFGMIQAKPTCVFGPVAVTPDELGAAWSEGRLHMTMEIRVNGMLLGRLATGEMGFSFGEIIAHAARTRTMAAGSIIGSGTVSNADGDRGVGCVAEKRAVETIATGSAATEWLTFGDIVHIEVFAEDGSSVFGAIHHTFAPTSEAAK